MPLIDVSVTVRPGMPVYPENPGPTIVPVQRIADGAEANVGRLDAGLHTGTHVDAARHFLEGGAGAEALPLDVLVGPALVVEATAVPDVLDANAIEGLLIPAGTERVLFRTRNSELWERGGFAGDFVDLDESGARLVVARGVRLVGLDYLSIGDAAAHRALLGGGVVVLEGLDLSQVTAGEYELLCLPLKIEGADGAPARVALRAP